MSAQDTPATPAIPAIPSIDDNGDNGGEFTMPSFPAMPGVDETETSPTISTSSNANAVCCNAKMGSNCPSGLNAALGGTLIGDGGVLTLVVVHLVLII